MFSLLNSPRSIIANLFLPPTAARVEQGTLVIL